MRYRRPIIKRSYPAYRLSDTQFRIGAQIGITSEFTDPNQEMWTLVQELNGDPWEEVRFRVRQKFPSLSDADIDSGLELLDSQGFIDEKYDTPVQPSRLQSNVNYFAGFPKITSEKAHQIQEKLKQSRVLLLGLGGGGSNILSLLSGVGFGLVTAVDYDQVEDSNLGRQLLYKEADLGKNKATAAAAAIAAQNSHITVTPVLQKVSSAQDVSELIDDHDIVIYALDEPPFLVQRWVNQAIVRVNVPCVFGATQVTHGRVFTIVPGQTGCFDCLHLHYSKRDPKFVPQFRGFHQANFRPPSVAYIPTIWQLTSIMVDEAVRLLTSYAPLRSLGVQLEVDYVGYVTESHQPWPKDDDCPTCGNGNYNDWEIFSEYAD